MQVSDFDLLLERRIELIRSVLSSKVSEYASDADRLHNFKRSAEVLGCSPAQAALGYMTKHFVSVMDIIKADAAGQKTPVLVLNEKLGDLVNYVILIEALLKE